MTFTGTPAVIKLPDGALTLVYRDGGIVRVERDECVTARDAQFFSRAQDAAVAHGVPECRPCSRRHSGSGCR